MVCWPLAPSAGHPGRRVVLVVVSVVVCDGLAAHAEEPPLFWWGRLLCGSSMLVECPTRVVPGASAAGRCPGRRRRGRRHRSRASCPNRCRIRGRATPGAAEGCPGVSSLPRSEISSEGALLGLVRTLVQAKGKSRLWEAAPRRLRLSCRRLRGCLRGRVAQIGVRGAATGPPDDGQREAAHLAPHLLARTGFHRTRLLLRGEPVARPSAGCGQLGLTSTEFPGHSCLAVRSPSTSLTRQGFRPHRKIADTRKGARHRPKLKIGERVRARPLDSPR